MSHSRLSLVALAGLCFGAACSGDDAPSVIAAASDIGKGVVDAAVPSSPKEGRRDGRPEDVAIESIAIEASGYAFDALAAGPEDGELVILLHGFPQTSFAWRPQLRALAQAGYRAVAPDQRGYSPGARPTEVAAYAVPNLVLDVVAMVDALEHERFHVVGHDWGGGIAWGLAGVFPERVISLSVLSTPHPKALVDSLGDDSSCQYQASSYFDIVTGSDIGAELLDTESFKGALGGLPAEVQTEYKRALWSDPKAFSAALNWYRANIEDRVFKMAAGPIAVPTLLVWGAKDPFFCREPAEASAALVTGVYRFVELEDAGHFLPEANAPEVSAELLAHLRDVQAEALVP